MYKPCVLSGGARAVGWIKDEGVSSPSDAIEAERLGRQPREDLDYELVRDREDRQSRCRPAAPFHLDKTSAPCSATYNSCGGAWLPSGPKWIDSLQLFTVVK